MANILLFNSYTVICTKVNKHLLGLDVKICPYGSLRTVFKTLNKELQATFSHKGMSLNSPPLKIRMTHLVTQFCSITFKDIKRQ